MTPAIPQAPATATVELQILQSLPLSALSVDDSGPPQVTYEPHRSKGLVQVNNLKHFPIDQYLHDRMTPATLSPAPLAYEKPIYPTEMPRITTRTELPIDDMNKSIPDDKYPWLDPDDIRRNMTDKEILQMKLNLKDSI